MHSLYPRSLLVGAALLVGCGSSTDDADSSGDALSQGSANDVTADCQLGKDCGTSMKLVSAGKAHDTNKDVSIDENAVTYKVGGSARLPTYLLQPGGVSFRLRGATPGSSWKVNKALIVLIFDGKNDNLLDAAYVGQTKGWFGKEGIKYFNYYVSGVADPVIQWMTLKQLGSDAVEHAAGEIDLGPMMPVNRPFSLEVFAVGDDADDAVVTDIVADIGK